MRTLALDYARDEGRSRLAVWALAAFALAFACDTGLRYQSLARDIAAKQLELARSRSTAGQTREVRSQPPALGADDLAAASDAARKLALPWSALFRALETSRTDRVALLAIEPDAEKRTVLLSAEAKDYAAALAYVGNLARQDTLANVYLSHHELKQAAGQRVLAITVSALWKDAR